MATRLAVANNDGDETVESDEVVDVTRSHDGAVSCCRFRNHEIDRPTADSATARKLRVSV